MNTLYELGLNETDIKNMVSINPDIINLSKKEILNKINILRQLECDDQIIRNIVTTNPNYLSLLDDDIFKLIKKLLNLGIERLDVTLDSNPLILNNESFEIDEYIKEKQQLGLDRDDIIDLIDSGMVE